VAFSQSKDYFRVLYVDGAGVKKQTLPLTEEKAEDEQSLLELMGMHVLRWEQCDKPQRIR
jgi:hypothetical protein